MENETKSQSEASVTVASLIKDLSADLRLTLLERLANPVIASILISAIVFHAKEILMIVFAGDKRLEIIQNFTVSYVKIAQIVAVGIAYSFGGPWLHSFYSNKTKLAKIKSIQIENDITSNNRLTLEQSKHLLARINELQPTVTKQQSEIDELQTKIKEFQNQIIDAESRMLVTESKHKSEIDKLATENSNERESLLIENSHYEQTIDDLLHFLKRIESIKFNIQEVEKIPTEFPKNDLANASTLVLYYKTHKLKPRRVKIDLHWASIKPSTQIISSLFTEEEDRVSPSQV